MTAILSRERAKATWLLGAAGVVMLAAAFVMMVCAAPTQAHAGRHAAVSSRSVTGERLASWVWATRHSVVHVLLGQRGEFTTADRGAIP
jgi:hypothetical protein